MHEQIKQFESLKKDILMIDECLSGWSQEHIPHPYQSKV